MTLTFGSSEFAKGTGRGEPAMVRGLDGARAVSSRALVGAAEPLIKSRKNVAHTLNVLVTRHHATPADAGDFVLSHAAAVWAFEGTLTIESPSGNKWTLSQAVVESCSLDRWVGATTAHAYVIRGGLLAAVPAPPPEE